MRDDRARLEDIRDAIADIDKRAPRWCEDLERVIARDLPELRSPVECMLDEGTPVSS